LRTYCPCPHSSPNSQIKYISAVLKDTSPNADGSPRPFYDFLQAALRHKSEMVLFAAARAIAELRDVAMRELAPAITVLQLFLSSTKPVLRFTAVRTLNKVRERDSKGEGWSARDECANCCACVGLAAHRNSCARRFHRPDPSPQPHNAIP